MLASLFEPDLKIGVTFATFQMSGKMPFCQDTTGPSVQPVKASELPENPWEYVAMDFEGSVGKELHFLVVVDEYSRYPEVAVVHSTEADEVLPALEPMFVTHGVPRNIKSDNGPPFKSQVMVTHAKQ